MHELALIPVFCGEAMNASVDSFSPSAAKPRAVVADWRERGEPIEVIAPTPVAVEDLKRTHDPAYVDGVLRGDLPNGFGTTDAGVAASLPFTCGAMWCAARAALRNGRVAVAPCSGFHHARHARAGGYCTFNGLIVAAQALRAAGDVARVGILDFDQHYGDGTDALIGRLGLDWIRHFTAGAEYGDPTQVEAFLARIPALVGAMRDCDVVLYQAGADPHIDDPLGGWMTTRDLAERDQRVFEAAATAGVPIAWNLAGGYQTPLRKVLDIHHNTLRACANVYLHGGARAAARSAAR